MTQKEDIVVEKCEAGSQRFQTPDGVELHYWEAGHGHPLVLVPGWSQSAEEFVYQINGLQQRYHVFALDHRGHGRSSKPGWGYRIARLAHDLAAFLDARDLKQVTVVGHSMGCSVIWSYAELFGLGRVRRIVLADQVASVLDHPYWSADERQTAGPIFSTDALFGIVGQLSGPDARQATVNLVSSMLTQAVPAEVRDWIVTQNLVCPRPYAARLLLDHSAQDWRDAVGRLTVPTLVSGAEASIFPWRAVRWIADQIPQGRWEYFSESEGGSHFMFFENPARFNALIQDFVQ
jgi:non-heme chloroperoxidase